ncbi:MAG: hypothetical protein GVY36_18600 [Verrucomicrobia bacterium]|jgi:hypothetical protein|nr:hypothetical protein [Verrucomicrobiota bacterium]
MAKKWAVVRLWLSIFFTLPEKINASNTQIDQKQSFGQKNSLLKGFAWKPWIFLG